MLYKANVRNILDVIQCTYLKPYKQQIYNITFIVVKNKLIRAFTNVVSDCCLTPNEQCFRYIIM